MEVSKNWDVIKASLVHDPTDLIEPPPWERGVYKYHGPGNVERQEEMRNKFLVLLEDGVIQNIKVYTTKLKVL